MTKLPMQLQRELERPKTSTPPEWCPGSVTKVWLLQAPQLDGCPNCGGSGRLYAFYSVSGPHPHATPNLKVTSKWVEDGWYYGESRSYPCPECNQDESAWYQAGATKSIYSE